MARKDSNAVTFGAEAPTSGNSYGIVVDHGVAWLAWAEDLSVPARRKKAEDQPSQPAARRCRNCGCID